MNYDPNNDVREAMSILDNIESTARLLVSLEYPEAEVKTVLRRDFPMDDADAACTAAVEHKRVCDEQVSQQLDRDAIQSEHNLTPEEDR